MDLIKETEAQFYLKKADGAFAGGDFKGALKDYLKVVELNDYLQKADAVAAGYRRIAECYYQMKVPLKEDQEKLQAGCRLLPEGGRNVHQG